MRKKIKLLSVILCILALTGCNKSSQNELTISVATSLLNPINEIIKEYVIDHKQPNKINNLVSQGKEGLILLNWEKTDDDILRYDVYRTVYGRNSYSKIGSCEGETFEDKTCKYGTTYSYKIIAVDKAENESDYSNETIVKRISDTQAPIVYGVLPANGQRI